MAGDGAGLDHLEQVLVAVLCEQAAQGFGDAADRGFYSLIPDLMGCVDGRG